MTCYCNFRYTFGKPVDGIVILTISKSYGSGFFDPKAVRTEMQLVSINKNTSLTHLGKNRQILFNTNDGVSALC